MNQFNDLFLIFLMISILYIIIETIYVKTITSIIKFDRINIDYFKSLKIQFYHFIQKPI
jgi:hypothetical protein